MLPMWGGKASPHGVVFGHGFRVNLHVRDVLRTSSAVAPLYRLPKLSVGDAECHFDPTTFEKLGFRSGFQSAFQISKSRSEYEGVLLLFPIERGRQRYLGVIEWSFEEAIVKAL